MKYTLAILFLFIGLHISLAEKPNEPAAVADSKDISETERDGAATVTASTSTEETTEIDLEKEKTHEKDSSEYSVNKFNYLFYLIYKVKYMGFEEELEMETQFGGQ